MPGKVRVKIVAGRNLPVMDRSSDTTDAYVEIKLGNTTFKTDVCRKSLNPQWNSEWYRFEVDDSELQDEPLQLRLMDHDTYSANDAIGKVYLDLNPLLLPTAPSAMKSLRADSTASVIPNSGSVMSGWIPVYDTMHGIRGEVHVIVKVELFSDFNRFRQSSCGVQFFCSPSIPQGYHAQVIHGFVEELVVNDDPEYQWIDKIRTPRASNEARQTLFFKLSGEVQRKIGLKALDLGGNAVIGYNQCFDLEGESGIVARGIGTAVSLTRLYEITPNHGPLNTSANDETAPVLYAAPTSPRLCIIPPTPTSNVNPTALSASQRGLEEESHVPLIGPRFPKAKSKKGKRRPVVVVPLPDTQKHHTHRRQGSAPFDLSRHVPYKRQNSTKSLVTDLSDLRHLLEQEDMRQSPGSPGSSRLMKAIRHLPKKVSALRGRLSSDDPDLDTLSCGSAKSLSLDFRRKSQKRSSTDSVTAALIRSIMMDSGNGLMDRGGLTRVVESEESATSAPGTPKMKLFSSTSEIELGGAKELLHEISSDIEEGVGFIESSNASSCDSSTTEDDISDSSAVDLKDEDNLTGDEDDLIEEKVLGDDSSVSGSASNVTDAQVSVGKNGKSRVTFLIGANTVDQVGGLRKKSRSLSPKGTNSITKTHSFIRKDGSLSPVILTSKNWQQAKQKDCIRSRSASPMDSVSAAPLKKGKKNKIYRSGSDLSTPSTPGTPAIAKEKTETSESPICPRKTEKEESSSVKNPFDREFGAAATALKTACRVMDVEDLPQPFQISNTFTPPNTAASSSLSLSSKSASSSVVVIDDGAHTSPSASQHELSVYVDSVVDNLNIQNKPDLTAGSETTKSKLDSDLPPLTEPTRTMIAVSVLEQNTLCRPLLPVLPTNCSMTETSESTSTSIGRPSDVETGVSDNPVPVCSLTLETPVPVLSPPPLHKSRSTTSLTAAATTATTHIVTDGEREGAQTSAPEEDRGASPGLLPHHPKHSQSPAKLNSAIQSAIHRRSSDSDLSVTPKGNSLTGSDRSSCTGGHHFRQPMMALQPPVMNQDNLDMLEYPFLTMTKFPPGFIQRLGGTVSSRSVKLLERITNLEEPETRDTWWKELRMEVRSHARALGCNVVLGYKEHTSICDDVCVLSAAGTAAMINLQYNPPELDTSGGATTVAANTTSNVGSSEKQSHTQQAAEQVQGQGQVQPEQPLVQPLLTDVQPSSQKQTSAARPSHDRVAMTTSLDRTDFEKERTSGNKGEPLPKPDNKTRHMSDGVELEIPPPCTVCHIPYSESSVPFRVKMIKCAMCRKGKVPDVLLSTMEPPDGIPVTGRGCLIQAYVCRPKRDTKGELNAKEISDGLPFLEYELHRMLLNKLKVKGMNSIFGLKVQVSIGERMLVGVATGTAVFLTPLPSPPVPTITAGNVWSDERRLMEVQRTLADTVKKNRELYQLKSHVEGDSAANGRSHPSDTDDSDDDLPDLDLAVGNKDTCVMEVDDNEDVDVISLLMDAPPPDGFQIVNTEAVPGLEDMEVVRNLQMFTQVWRAKVAPSMPPTVFSKHFHRMLQSVYFKLRRMVPCALAELQFFVELPEPDELQLSLLGMALGLREVERINKFKRKQVPPSTSKEQLKKDDHDLIFSLEEDVVLEDTTGAAAVAAAAAAASSTTTSSTSVTPPPTISKVRPKSPNHLPAQTQIQRSFNTTKLRHTPPKERYGVDITPLSYIPGGKIERYLGNLNFFFIRESTGIRESGGLSGFVHSFIAEVLAIVRAHVTALGGNAMVSYFISENVLIHNPHKNQGQCLVNVGGDVVHASYCDEQ